MELLSKFWIRELRSQRLIPPGKPLFVDDETIDRGERLLIDTPSGSISSLEKFMCISSFLLKIDDCFHNTSFHSDQSSSYTHVYDTTIPIPSSFVEEEKLSLHPFHRILSERPDRFPLINPAARTHDPPPTIGVA